LENKNRFFTLEKVLPRNETGFSLVEVIIAGGLLAATALAGAQVFKTSIQAKRKLETHNGRVIIGDDVRNAMRDIATCSANLVGKRADQATNDIALYRLLPSGTPGIFEKALTPFIVQSPIRRKEDALEITRVTLQPKITLTPQTRLLELVISSKSPEGTDSKESIDRIPIQVAVNSSGQFITGCLGVEGDAEDIATGQLACELKVNGTNSDLYFDTETQTCEYSKYSTTRWGNSSEAHCDPGEQFLSCDIRGGPRDRESNPALKAEWDALTSTPGPNVECSTGYYNGVPQYNCNVNIWTCHSDGGFCRCDWNFPQFWSEQTVGAICAGTRSSTSTI
jgi:type II secretory pathway pseudopilin PulG